MMGGIYNVIFPARILDVKGKLPASKAHKGRTHTWASGNESLARNEKDDYC
jgi:hypothetical protein